MILNIIAAFFMLIFISVPVFAITDNKILCASLALKSQDKNISLPGVDESRTPKIYFLKNISQKSLWLDHPVEHVAASAGWSSYLRPGNSSALLVNRKNFTISCAVISPGKVDYLDCEKAIAVCVPKQATMTTNRKGVYWLAEDQSAEELLKTLEKRGVKVK